MIKKISKKSIMILLISCSLALSGCLNFQSRWSTGGLGIQLAQVEDGVLIKDIAPTFNNEDAALLKGDYIIMVDGENVTGQKKEEILDAISGPVGSTVTITVLRQGKLVTLEIERILLKNADRKTLYSVARPTAVMAKPEKPADTSGESAEAPPSEWKSDNGDRENSDSDSTMEVEEAPDSHKTAPSETTDHPQLTDTADTDA